MRIFESIEQVPANVPFARIAHIQASQESISLEIGIRGFSDIDDLGNCLRQVFRLKNDAVYILTTYEGNKKTSAVDVNLYSKSPTEMVKDFFEEFNVDINKYLVYIDEYEFNLIKRKLMGGELK